MEKITFHRCADRKGWNCFSMLFYNEDGIVYGAYGVSRPQQNVTKQYAKEIGLIEIDKRYINLTRAFKKMREIF